MRTYRRTRFDIDPAGFAVATGDGRGAHEKKIDLPESWVMGFLQVHSTMTLGLTRFRMAPVDLFNICRFLRRHRAKISPRALRYELVPGQPVRVVLEPWEHVDRAVAGLDLRRPEAADRPHLGPRPAPDPGAADPGLPGVDVYLAGFGLPSIYVLDLGPAVHAGPVGLDRQRLDRRRQVRPADPPPDVSPDELTRIYEALRTLRRGDRRRPRAGGRARRREGPERPVVPVPGRPGDVRPGRRRLPPPRPVPRAVLGPGGGRGRQARRRAGDTRGGGGPGDLRRGRRPDHRPPAGLDRLQAHRQRQGRRRPPRPAPAARRPRGPDRRGVVHLPRSTRSTS